MATSRRPRLRTLVRSLCLAAVASLALAACGTSASKPPSPSSGTPVKGGTASFDLGVGDDFSWIFPLDNEANWEPWDFNISYDSWRPLYFAGAGNKPIVSKALSIAYPPTWSNDNRTVTVKLKPMKWSDGQPVTSRDVQFFFNLYKANKSRIAQYTPGEIPDDIASVTYPSKTTFVLHLKKRYSQQWFYGNQLTDIVPMPQQAWDKESANGPVGNYDLTTSGAKKVFNFLWAQTKQLSTYSTNPLWKVVDGPWVMTSYDPTTHRLEESANKHYTGAQKPYLAHVVYETNTSDTAEVDALRSGSLTYGYLPFNDLGLTGYLQSHGYTVAPWAPEYVNWAEFGYTSKTYGPLVKQLYIRQALQHLVNEPLYLKATLHNYGQLSYGPVPNLPGSPWVSPQEKKDPYPYSKSSAKQLMSSHGWKMGSGHTLVCENAGTGPNQCGKGIASGRSFGLKLMYSTGYPNLVPQVEAFQTAANSVGMTITLDPQTQNAMFSIGGTCPPGPCDWGIIWYADWMWDYGPGAVYPTGGQEFGKGGNYWSGGYYSPKAQRLIDATQTATGLSHLYKYENYISEQEAGLWVPTADNSISVVSNKLHGWQPQQVFADPLPERWYYTK